MKRNSKIVALALAAVLALGVFGTGCSGEGANEPAADKAALEASLQGATDVKKSDYTADTYEALQAALTEAQTIAADEAATQEQIDAAQAALDAAIAALVEKPKMTDEQESAVGRAKGNMRSGFYSLPGLIAQLETEGFAHDDAVFAAEYIGADFNAAALGQAKLYLNQGDYTKETLAAQLQTDGFTAEEADYAVSNIEWPA